MMKKIFLLLMSVLAALLLFTACSSEQIQTSAPSPSGTTGNNTKSDIVISIYDDGLNLIGKYTYNKPEDNTLDVSSFVKEGYTFEGVYDMSRDIMLFNANGIQSPMMMFDTDFKAVLKYSPIVYQMVFEAGQGRLENSENYIKNISYDELLGLFPAVVNDGMELDGWFDEDGNRYSFGMSPVYTKFNKEGFSLSNETIKLYAHYTDKYYTVTLLYQNGASDVQLKVKHGDKLSDLTEYLKDDGSRAVAGFGVSPTATDLFDQAVYTDLELYAIWKDYKYVYFAYGEDDIRMEKIFRNGNMSTLPDGELEGYKFEGWYGSQLLTGSKITSVPFSSLASTYYARWSVAEYTISFIADGKLVSSSKFSIEGADIFVPPVPSKSHYTGKWEDYTLEYRDITVNALYEAETVKLTLMSGGNYTYQTVKYGDSFSLSVPKKKGYDFDGWFYKDTRVTSSDGNSLEPYSFETEVTLNAKWISTKCTLYFETNGGNAIDSVEINYGEPYKLTQIPERTGFYFGGWFDETLTNEYTDSITVTGNTIVYAKWVKSVEIYDADGLKAIADNPYGNYHLTSNINLRGEVWEPITSFSGILNGNGFKIYNFSLRKDNTDLAFIINNSGTIKNLAIENVEQVSSIEGDITCSIAIMCANNTGRIANCTIKKVSMLINASGTNYNEAINGGILTGENSGVIQSCSVDGSLILKADFRAENVQRKADLFMGGIAGKDSGTVLNVKSKFAVDVNELVYSCNGTSQFYGRNYAWKAVYLNIGSIVGTEYGTLKNGIGNFTCKLYSEGLYGYSSWGGIWNDERYTHIGGIVGGVYESGTVSDCYSYGSGNFVRIGAGADAYDFYTGGVVGYVESGNVDNCASSMNLTLTKGYSGYMSGIVGYIAQNGRVSNVACYGSVNTESYDGGSFTGIAGGVDGILTKAYFHGKVNTNSTNAADIAGNISTSGSVSKIVDNGNLRIVLVENKGQATDNYVIGKGEYDETMLTDINLLFEKLCLFEADVWSVDEKKGLHLISFPEYSLPEVK